MKLPHEFCRLPVSFDAQRLREEALALPPIAWAEHPTGYPGNSAVRLIAQDGGENDEVAGQMQVTPWMAHCPYVQQVLNSFGVVWSRSRLMRLAPGAQVPQHCDVSYHWKHRARIHIPLITAPTVRFFCGMKSVHMGAGEAWIFDNWRPHRVVNGSTHERIHLVADTQGNAAFWSMVGTGEWRNFQRPAASRVLPYRAVATPPLLTERYNRPVVMSPSEVESLAGDLIADLGTEHATDAAKLALGEFKRSVLGFCREWRQVWSLYADTLSGWRAYAELRQQLRQQIAAIQIPVFVWSNQTLATKALEAGLLLHVLNPPGAETHMEDEYAHAPAASGDTAVPDMKQRMAAPPSVTIDRPIFIVSAPRSGSTLLFETLAQSESLWTVGGEAHGMIEQFAALQPGAPGVDSNRLDASAASETVITGVRQYLSARARSASGALPLPGSQIRFLEKTPKNSLRIPLLRACFPNARFIFLWRAPQENIASIIEAWQAGGWITYPNLAGWTGPWSLLLPPGWRAMHGKPLPEIANFQWQTTNEMVMRDLESLPPDQWLALSHEQFIQNTVDSVRRICDFADLGMDPTLSARIHGELPWSRHTQSRPDPEKWRTHAQEIATLEPIFRPTWERLIKLTQR